MKSLSSIGLVLYLFVAAALAQTTPPESPYTGLLFGDSSEIFRNDDNIAEESIHSEEYYPSFILPKSVINEGKPFYAAKDPVTGKFDFNVKKTVGIQNDVSEANELVDNKDQDIRRPNDVNTIAQNFHDFLNLPVKYSSQNSVHPLISSSYSNFNYQGNNKQFVSNHRNFSTTTTTSPKYYTNPTTNKRFNQSSTTVKAASHRPSYSTKSIPSTTTTRPTTTVSTTKTSPTTAAPTSAQTTTTKSTTRSQFTRFPYKSTTKNKYLESQDTRKKYQTTTELPKVPEAVQAEPINQLNAVIFEDESKKKNDTNRVVFPTAFPNRRATATSRITTTVSSTVAPTTTTSTSKPYQHKKIDSVLRKPSPFIAPNSSGFKPISPTQQTPQAPAAASVLEQSRPQPRPLQNQQQPSVEKKKDATEMTLSELFNTIAGEETVQEQNTLAYEPSKNTMEFVTMRPSIGSSSNVNIEDFDDVNNHYVKYEVQQPNMNVNMQQYKPVSSMNNIVISPDQHSASFVLGSQQSVGGSGLFMGSNSPPEPPFRQQYQSGTVIDEIKVVEQKPPATHFSSSSSGTMKVEQPQNVLTASVRFPDDAELKTHSFEDAPIVKGTIKKDDVPASPNGHSAPVALAQNQIVVFPPNEKMAIDVVNAELGTSEFKEVKNRIVFENDNSVSDNAPQQQLLLPQQQQQQPQQQHQQQQPPQHHQQQQFNQQQQPQQQTIQQAQNHQFAMKQEYENSVNANGQNLPQLAENLTPPSYYPSKEPMNRVAYEQNSQRPLIRQPVPQQHSQPPFMYNELTRKPYNGPTPPRQYLERPLPNILPQFRPNTSKMGQGPPLAYAKNDGPMRGPHYPNHMQQRPPLKYHHAAEQKYGASELNPSVGPPPPPSAHQIRRAPLPNRLISRINNGPPMNMEGNNRRYYRVPQPGPQPPMIDRVFMKPVQGRMPPQHMPMPPRGYYPKQRSPILTGEPKHDDRQTHFLDYELNHGPPTSSTEKPKESKNPFKLEPVVTLQMLQSKKQFGNNELNTKLSLQAPQKPETHLTLQQQQQQQQQKQQQKGGVDAASDKSPVYVVYPVKNSPQEMNAVPTDADSAVVVGQRGEAAPLPPSKISQISPGTEYQNTPFTVVSHFEQEPILMAKTKPVRTNFPYHLEKPVTKENDYQISSTLKRITEKPIAIAYTPTEPNHNYYYQKPQFDDKFSMPNYGSPVISEIRDESQTESSLYNHDDTKYHNYEDNFQAPFHASINLGGEKISNSYEGWSIVTPSASSLQANNNKIDRSDDNVEEHEHEKPEKKNNIESNQFQPEYLSGFKPIYPTDTDPKQDFVIKNDHNNYTIPEPRTASTAAALTATTLTDDEPAKSNDKKTASISTSSAITTAKTTTTTTTAAPAPSSSTKKIEIDSLEAFFDEFTKDYDDEENSTNSNRQ